MKRLFALIISVLIICTLFTGCSMVEGLIDMLPFLNKGEEASTPTANSEEAAYLVEYSAIAAVLLDSNGEDEIDEMRMSMIEQGDSCAIHDYDGDGTPELITSCGVLGFDYEKRSLEVFDDVMPGAYFIGSDNCGYAETFEGSGYVDIRNGKEVAIYDSNTTLYRCKGGRWERLLELSTEEIREHFSESNEEGPIIGETHIYKQNGEEVSETAYTAAREALGLMKVESTVDDYTSNSFNDDDADDILKQVGNHLNDAYSGYSKVKRDIDGDGKKETLFAISDIMKPWADSIRNFSGSEYALSLTAFSEPRSAIIVADEQDSRLLISAYALNGTVSGSALEDAAVRSGSIWIDGKAAYMSSKFDSLSSLNSAKRADVVAEIARRLGEFGDTDIAIRRADVADFAGDELICFARQKGNTWRTVIYGFDGGTPRVLGIFDNTDAALYIINIDGKNYLMTYNQYMSTKYASYAYSVLRFDASGKIAVYDSLSASAETYGGSAVGVAGFFEKFNGYFVTARTVCDPYQINGSQWAKGESYEYGAPPAEPGVDADGNADSRLGFVQIKDPSSWLNLREGPGTDYDLVLIDENDPESFVRQAQGSPVTILETIETGDKDNPVWVKIRITYQDKEIVGYSSKSFIRLAGE